MMIRRLVAAVAVVSAGLAPTARAGDGLPAEFQQIIPRGRLASVDEPRFVPAQKAKLPAEAWIFGVVIEGQPRAYSLNLLNQHEIVNDRVGTTAFAAVW